MRRAETAIVERTSVSGAEVSTEIIATSGVTTEGPPPRARPRVLVVDDDPEMLFLLETILEESYDVETAPDGSAALAALRARAADLVLTDLMMPGLDGFGLLQALRGDPALATIPVIMLSARGGVDTGAEGLRAGADDYLPKPFSADELQARVAVRLELARLRGAAHRERRDLFAVFMQAPVAIAAFEGPSHVVVLANDELQRMVGRTVALGTPLADALPELTGPAMLDLHARAYGEGRVERLDEFPLQLEQHDGRTTYHTAVFQPLRAEGGAVTGHMVIAMEVTDRVLARRQLEENARDLAEAHETAEAALAAAEAAGRAKDEFLAMLGHELRNPLAPIATALQLMRLRGGGALYRERAIIERQMTHLERLVDDLLDVSRMTRGDLPLDKKLVEVSAFVARAIELASPLLERRQHRLEVNVPVLGLRVHGDSARLAQVVANLLTNAAKYTPPNGHLTVSAELRGTDVVVRVADDGIGIEPDMLARIFEVFYQTPQPLDRAAGGLGLGLSIVRNIVQAHGGRVEAHSDGPGKGSEIVVVLPGATPESTHEADEAPRSSAQSSRARVLVVDDNIDAAATISELLEALGYETRTAHDGPSALTAVEVFTPDLAVLDIGLPGMDGYELARLLRQREELSRLPIVALTGYGQEEDRQRSRDAGIEYHLVKPVDLSALALALEKAKDAAP